MRPALAIATLLLGTSPVVAQFNGADLLGSDDRFASGFIFGVVEAMTGFNNEGFTDQNAIRTCLIGSGIMTDEMLAAVRRYIEKTPSSLIEPGYVVVIKTVREICIPAL